MLDYRLHVFMAVAMRLSFSKAAEELHITQPAVTRHIKQLEEHFDQKLFDRKGNSISLTASGAVLLTHTKALLRLHKNLEFDMNALIDKTAGQLKIAASTTIAQYVLPEMLAKFHQKYPAVKVTLISANTEIVEHAVIDQDVEIGFIEGYSKNRELSYQNFLRDEIVLVVARGHALYNSPAINTTALLKLPLVLREKGSGSLEFVQNALSKVPIVESQLQIEMRLGSSEGIKSYLKDNSSAAFLSVNTILNELNAGALGVVDIQDFSIERSFSFILKQGHRSPLSSLFIDFLANHYNIML